MSDYLVRELEAIPNIDIRLNTEIVDARGDSRLEGVTLRDNATGTTDDVPAAAAFILIGAVPRTDWLPPEIERDERGFILTGADRPISPGRTRRRSTGWRFVVVGYEHGGRVRGGRCPP